MNLIFPEVEFEAEVDYEIYSSVNIYVKYEVDVDIDGSVYCDIDRIVGDEVFRSNDSRLESDVEGEVGIGYGEWFELEVGYEVDPGDDRSFNKGVNM